MQEDAVLLAPGPRWHTGHKPRRGGKSQYSYWKEQGDAEVWIAAVHGHFLPWLQTGFEFGLKVLRQQMGHGIKMWSHRYSAKDPSCKKRWLQPPRKNTHACFQRVPIQRVRYYRLPRSPLCRAALPFHPDESFFLLASPALGYWWCSDFISQPCFCTVLHLCS